MHTHTGRPFKNVDPSGHRPMHRFLLWFKQCIRSRRAFSIPHTSSSFGHPPGNAFWVAILFVYLSRTCTQWALNCNCTLSQKGTRKFCACTGKKRRTLGLLLDGPGSRYVLRLDVCTYSHKSFPIPGADPGRSRN